MQKHNTLLLGFSGSRRIICLRSARARHRRIWKRTERITNQIIIIHVRGSRSCSRSHGSHRR